MTEPDLIAVAAVQDLPPRHRVVLILRDVLEWPAAEVAELLGVSLASLDGTLQRARAGLGVGEADQSQSRRLNTP
ncbi:MAG: sigma factor-like helix-turn-helix DNA-binding protein [Acidimicrobiales bacterium]